MLNVSKPRLGIAFIAGLILLCALSGLADMRRAGPSPGGIVLVSLTIVLCALLMAGHPWAFRAYLLWLVVIAAGAAEGLISSQQPLKRTIGPLVVFFAISGAVGFYLRSALARARPNTPPHQPGGAGAEGKRTRRNGGRGALG